MSFAPTLPSQLLRNACRQFVGLIGAISLVAGSAWGATATSTTLASSVNPTYVSESTTLTATVTPAVATGSVTFKDGTTTLGTGTLSAGVATLITSFKATGAHQLTAVYAGDSTYSGSTSAARTQTVNAKTGSTTVLTSSINPSAIGQNTTLTATVTGNSPTGRVGFYDGTTALGVGTVSGGVATLVRSFATTGTHNLKATYVGDTANTSSTSAVLAQTVNAKGSSTTVLASSPNPSAVGQSVTLTAKITGVAPTGQVVFMDGTTTLGTGTVSAGVATLTTAFKTTGSHSLTAVYKGDDTNDGSTSLALTQTVNAKGASTTVITTSTNPSYVRQSTTLTATVTGASPTGTVSFRDGTATIGSAPLSGGLAKLETSFATTGSHLLTAVYSGDAINGSSSSTYVRQTVNKAASTSTLVTSPNPSALNQAVTLTATVAGANPTGTVTFMDAGTTLGSATIANGVATYTASFSASGKHSLTALYAGDSLNNASTSAAANQTVSVTATTTALSASATSVTVGQNLTLTAKVMPATATGAVTFMDGTVVLGTGTLSAGSATLTTSFKTAGSHRLTAVYAGTSDYSGSTSAAFSETVNAAPSSTALTISANPAYLGQGLTLTATVTGVSPTGTVTFKDGTTTLGTGSLNAGIATLVTSFGTTGSHSLSATYGGSSGSLGSTSSTLVLAIKTAPSAPLPAVAGSPALVVGYEYDAKGNLTRVTQAPGTSGFDFKSVNTYDQLDRIKSSIDPRLGKTQFEHDGQDRVVRVTDPRNLVTQMPRDGLGQVSQLVSPDTGTAARTYDAAGNLKTRLDSRGVLETHSYDALNRRTSSVYSKTGQTALSHSWTYDQRGAGFANGVGRLTTTTHPSGSGQYTYDPEGRLASDTQRIIAAAGANSTQVSLSVVYGYDAAGHLVRIVYPSGRVLNIVYAEGLPNALSLAKDTSSTSVSLISQLKFAPFAGPESWLWHVGGTTLAHERVYDTSGRTVRYRLGGVARDLAYDAAGRIAAYTHRDAGTAVTMSALDQSFGYDQNGRLTSITTATASWSIGYDANGNRTGVSLNGAPSTYVTEATSNRLQSTSGPARSLGYDSAGNTTSDTGGYTATYDIMGRLSTLTKAGVTTTYSYNEQGQRVRKFSGIGAASTTLFAYDQNGQLLGEYDGAGKAIREYVWLGSTPVAVFMPDGATTNPPQVYFIHADHLDTPRVVVDRNNALRWRWFSEPFGTTAAETNPGGLGVFVFNLRMPGQYLDQESGLLYNWNRYYDPGVGRYVQSDPIGLNGGVNTYSYVVGNPVSFSDPNGLQAAGLARFIVPVLAGLGLIEASRPKGMTAKEESYFDKFCRTSDDPCLAIKIQTNNAIDAAYEKMGAMQRDPQGLFRNAYSTPNPSVTETNTTWIGHKVELEGRIAAINSLISLGQKMGCDMTTEVIRSQGLYVPNMPTGVR